MIDFIDRHWVGGSSGHTKGMHITPRGQMPSPTTPERLAAPMSPLTNGATDVKSFRAVDHLTQCLGLTCTRYTSFLSRPCLAASDPDNKAPRRLASNHQHFVARQEEEERISPQKELWQWNRRHPGCLRFALLGRVSSKLPQSCALARTCVSGATRPTGREYLVSVPSEDNHSVVTTQSIAFDNRLPQRLNRSTDDHIVSDKV
jgi:hypothetical protein